MFTPPPSPRPIAADQQLSPTSPSGSWLPSPASLSPSPSKTHRSHRPPSIHLAAPSLSIQTPTSPVPVLAPLTPVEKKRIGARTRLVSVFLIPTLLFLITLSTRAWSHPVALDLLSPGTDARWSLDTITNWRPHKRHPMPQNSGSGQGQGRSFVGTSAIDTSLIFPTSLSQTASPTASQGTSTGGGSELVPTVPSSPPVLPTPFPQAFDSTLGQNFTTQNCADFFANMTQSAPFRACRPFSLLFRGSASFINAQSNLTLLNAVVWGTCNTNTPEAQCASNMSWFADTLQETCKTELTGGNAMAAAALTGLKAYSVMRQAACTTNPTTNTYCLVDAIRAPTASDIYFFGLPLGTPLPAATKPTCSSCSKSLLGLYAPVAPANSNLVGGAANTTGMAMLPALGNGVYATAARSADTACGQEFAGTGTGNGAGTLHPTWLVGGVSLILTACTLLW